MGYECQRPICFSRDELRIALSLAPCISVSVPVCLSPTHPPRILLQVGVVMESWQRVERAGLGGGGVGLREGVWWALLPLIQCVPSHHMGTSRGAFPAPPTPTAFWLLEPLSCQEEGCGSSRGGSPYELAQDRPESPSLCCSDGGGVGRLEPSAWCNVEPPLQWTHSGREQ